MTPLLASKHDAGVGKTNSQYIYTFQKTSRMRKLAFVFFIELFTANWIFEIPMCRGAWFIVTYST